MANKLLKLEDVALFSLPFVVIYYVVLSVNFSILPEKRVCLVLILLITMGNVIYGK